MTEDIGSTLDAAKTLAKRGDPPTSIAAAVQLIVSGSRRKQAAEVVAIMWAERQKGRFRLTGRELDDLHGSQDAHKRLGGKGELEDRGIVRRVGRKRNRGGGLADLWELRINQPTTGRQMKILKAAEAIDALANAANELSVSLKKLNAASEARPASTLIDT